MRLHTNTLWASILTAAMTLTASCTQSTQETKVLGPHQITLATDTLTPEVLWAMGRIGSYATSPDGTRIAYQVSYYSVEENRSQTLLYCMNADGQDKQLLTTGNSSESSPAWFDNTHLTFMSQGEVWIMEADGSARKQLSQTDGKVEGYLFAPNRKHVILIQSIPYNGVIEDRHPDLPQSSGMVINDLMYRHWDHYVQSIPHPFVAPCSADGIGEATDILNGQLYECPMAPFGGIEQLAWSTDSKQIAYTCRAKTGMAYSISTDSDIYLYDLESGSARNLCKAADYQAPACDPTKSLKNQPVNAPENLVNFPGYDQNPQFSPDGKYLAWLSMARDGYESDRQRLCILDLQSGQKHFVTETFDSNVDQFAWNTDSHSLYFIGVWHATTNLYRTDLNGTVTQLTNECADFGSFELMPNGNLLAERHDHMNPADLYLVTPGTDIATTNVSRLTDENEHILSQLACGSTQERWVRTTDGQFLHYWVVLPPNFDASKKYPTLLYCQGGPQSPVSQFWSYRWNFRIMASQGYVVIAPNRRGLPGFGSKWCEDISGDWSGQCISDYLVAIDDAATNLPYVDADRLAAVGASFGGYSVYYLAGHHDKRFKCFISHDGAFNLEAMYTETEENWFSNWEYEDAYWNQDRSANADRTYRNSPHLFVDKWDTPILCIHGEKDYRINATQGMSAFNAARMKGIEAQLLLYPDENHWVLKPQNGILWQRTFFSWLKRWIGNDAR